jgi:tetratricopeptide (TPR) repeat protein
MDKRKKLAISISITVIILVVIFSVTKSIRNNSYRNQIPALPDFTALSEPVREQLSLAHQEAYDNPTSDNIGQLGMVYHSSANYDQAKQCYQLATQKDQSKWIWNYYLGYLNQEMGDSKEAITNFNSVIDENPNALMIWYYLGKAYRNSGTADKAEAAFNKIANITNENSAEKSIRLSYSSLSTIARFELARTYLNTNKINEAEKLLKEVEKGNETVGPLYRLLGNVYSAKGDSILSRKYITRAQDLAVGTTVNDTLIDRITLISRSELYLPKQIDEANKSNNPEWASILFDHALQYLPDNKHIINKAIKFFLQMNKGEKALPFLDKNFNNFRESFNEMSEISSLLYIKGYYPQALPYFEQTMKLAPDSFAILKNYALCYWKDNKKDSALEMMDQIYANNKNNPQVLSNMVDFCLYIKDNDKAKGYLAKFKQVAPSDPAVQKLGAIIAEMDGNKTAAIILFEAAYKSDPTDVETAKKLGFFYTEERIWDKAISLFRNSLKYHPNESVFLEKLGTLLISCPDPKLQNIPEGLELSERAYFHVSSTPETLLAVAKNLALGHAMTGNFQDANSYIKIAINIARSEKVSKAYMDGLLRLQGGIEQASKK